MRYVFDARWFWKTATELSAATSLMPLPHPLTWEAWTDWIAERTNEGVDVEGEILSGEILQSFRVAQYLSGGAGMFEVNGGKTVLLVVDGVETK